MCWLSCWALVMAEPSTAMIKSPERSPAARAGLGEAPTSEAPTTSTPAMFSATPMDCPPGIT